MHILTNVSYAADGKVYAGQPSRFENKKDAVDSAKRQLAEDFGITMEELEESAQEGGDPYVISMNRDGRFEAYTVAEVPDPSPLSVSTHGSKGYKVFKPNWTCKGYRYEVGKTYKMNEWPVPNERGFHFCERLADCFSYYRFDSNYKVAEVEAVGEVVSGNDVSCTNEIKIIKELTWEEVLQMVNIGKDCTGIKNSGNRNSGKGNSGDRNTGEWNSGNRNSGGRNSGNRNSGNGNSGDWNSGDYNSGNRNSGDRNSGGWNSGDYNSGYGNSGNYNSGEWNSGKGNSGNWNSGNGNSGDWNTTDGSSGCFCTEEAKILMFNKLSSWTLKDWWHSNARILLNQIPHNAVEWIWEEDMTDEEKQAHPEHKTTEGYLKTMKLTETAQKWWDGLANEEKNVITSLPNFNAVLFKECTGIDTSCSEAE